MSVGRRHCCSCKPVTMSLQRGCWSRRDSRRRSSQLHRVAGGRRFHGERQDHGPCDTGGGDPCSKVAPSWSAVVTRSGAVRARAAVTCALSRRSGAVWNGSDGGSIGPRAHADETAARRPAASSVRWPPAATRCYRARHCSSRYCYSENPVAAARRSSRTGRYMSTTTL